ncbi:exodeoxyribonuclease VII large subunit [Rhodohalobacter barkolensis]|uniref:Exodeoxyribonuclease 7 large subunit n=1 Tax=Rhodohalobacter barkolensis TaxID=2053187 RepID=A0A2N0VFF0_9BACT|nr:exodeoxyribonuclease VII large subunit [Rhodohalobacter barkolensis]PKD42912.1 exodeoxyribonuclease VII large subunit [Rhodohalobacter barkolensis]
MKNQIPFSFDVPTVSEITEKIKGLLERNFRDILVEGEISNVNQSRNGHYYFTVKDDDAQLPCVIWRSTAQRMEVEIRDGQQVVLGGDLQVYAPHGRYQMIVSLVQQAGIGKLQQKFEQLKKKLEEEGLFSDSYKKSIPPFPTKIGVITSATGAAFHDIKSTFEQRWPVATLYLHHASVQGLNAAPELVKAIEWFGSQKKPVDLLIIGRGGGSLEDLWPFNEETVARAVFNCPIPTISAVGHEVDFSITDFVADARAATPTQAVVIAAPDINELRYMVDDYASDMETILQQKIQTYREYVYRLANSHALLVVQEKLKFQKNRVDALLERMNSRMDRAISERRSHIQQLNSTVESSNPKVVLQKWGESVAVLSERLENRYERMLSDKKSALNKQLSLLAEVNPKAPLERGFTRILQDGVWIRSSKHFKKSAETEIEWNDGSAKIKSV